MAAPTFPTPILEIEFTASVWTDVSADLVSARTTQGRSDQLSHFSAGTATVTLKNNDRTYDPTYAAGPYFGDLLPNKRIRLRSTDSVPTTRPQWQGYIDGYRQTYDLGNHAAECEIEATDAFGRFALQSLPRSVYELTIAADAPTAWWQLQEKAGLAMVDSSTHHRHGYYTPGTTDRTVPSLIAAQSEVTSLWFDGIANHAVVPLSAQPATFPFSFECWLRSSTSVTTGPGLYYQTDGTNSVVVMILSSTIFAYVSDGTNFVESLAQQDVLDLGLAHHIVVTFSDGTTAPVIYIDGALQVVTSNVAGTAVVGTGTAFLGIMKSLGVIFHGVLGQCALYDAVLDANQVTAHFDAGRTPWEGDDTGARVTRVLDAIGWPGGDRDIDTGITFLGPAIYDSPNVLTYLQDIESTEQGMLFVGADGKVVFRSRHWVLTATAATTVNGTFVDDGSGYSEIEYVFDNAQIYNQVAATPVTGGEQVANDLTSQIAYGVQRLDLGSQLWGTPGEAFAIAEWILLRYATPITRASLLRLKPQGNTTLMAQSLGRLIGDRVRVERTPQAVGSAIDQQVLIERIDQNIDCKERRWETTWGLGASDLGGGGTVTAFWRWGTAVWGTDTIWAA